MIHGEGKTYVDEPEPPLPLIGEVLTDPGASQWLKDALKSALSRDVVDAANDAELLARLLDREARDIARARPQAGNKV